MANDIKVIIDAILDDKDFNKRLKGMDTNMKKSAKTQGSILSKMKVGWLAVAGVITGVVAGIKKAFDFSKEFAEYQQGMDALARNTGQNSNKIIAKLREVSKGTISNRDLVLAANRAVALNVTKDVNKMAALLETSRLRAKAMGITTTQAFNDIVTGIGRESPLILDNLGIITKGWAEEAKAVGKAFDQQFIMNKILDQSRGALQKAGATTVTYRERIEQMGVAWRNTRLIIGRLVTKEISPLIEKMGEFVASAKGMKTIQNIIKGIVVLFKVLAFGIKTTFLIMNGFVLGSIKVFKELGGIISRVKKDGIGALGSATVQAGKNVINTLKNLGKSVKKDAKGIFDGVKDLISGSADEIDTELERINKGVGGAALPGVETGKGAGAGLEEAKASVLDYYEFLDMQREIDLAKEQENYEKALAGLQLHLDNKEITEEEYFKKVEELNEKHNQNMLKLNEPIIGALTDSWDKAINTVANSYADGIANMIFEGEAFKKTFVDFITDIVKEFGKLLVKMALVKAAQATLGGAFGFLFSRGGKVPGPVYAQDGFKPRGTDSIPAMLTPGERVLTVAETNAFENLLKTVAIPNTPLASNVTTNTVNEGDTVINNEFNNQFENNTVEDMIELSQNLDRELFRR